MTDSDRDSLRRIMDRDLLDRLARFETRLAEIDSEASDERLEIKMALQRVIEWQSQHEQAMRDVEKLLSAGYVFRVILACVIGALGLIAAIPVAVEAFNKMSFLK